MSATQWAYETSHSFIDCERLEWYDANEQLLAYQANEGIDDVADDYIVLVPRRVMCDLSDVERILGSDGYVVSERAVHVVAVGDDLRVLALDGGPL